MSAPDDRRLIPAALREQAAAWHVRVGSDAATEADWLAFEAWLGESPEHGRAYDAIEEVWLALDDAPAAPVVLLRPRSRRAMSWAAGAIAASVVAAVGVTVTVQNTQPQLAPFATALGERRVITLADGTHITLNGNSKLTAGIGRRERRVEMADAEAVFDVAHDPGRPFLIRAGDRQIRVVGTEFNVLRHAGEVRVTVRRGIVEVRDADEPGGPPLARLTKGQALAHREGEAGDRVTETDPSAAFAWTEGRLVFQGETLGAAVVTLNRYVATPITVAPEAQTLPVRAVLTIGPEDAMLKSLAAFLPVQVERQEGSVRLSLRHAAR